MCIRCGNGVYLYIRQIQLETLKRSQRRNALVVGFGGRSIENLNVSSVMHPFMRAAVQLVRMFLML